MSHSTALSEPEGKRREGTTVLRPEGPNNKDSPVRYLFQIANTIVGGLQSLLFSWWLDPWLHRRKQNHLANAIKQNFLPPLPMTIVESHHLSPQFGYATAYVEVGNMLIGITKFQNELPVTIGPSATPSEQFELLKVIAALEGTKEWQIEAPRTLEEAGNLLQPRWEKLNDLFSPARAAAREALQLQKFNEGAPESQLEWERQKRSWL